MYAEKSYAEINPIDFHVDQGGAPFKEFCSKEILVHDKDLLLYSLSCLSKTRKAFPKEAAACTNRLSIFQRQGRIHWYFNAAESPDERCGFEFWWRCFSFFALAAFTRMKIESKRFLEHAWGFLGPIFRPKNHFLEFVLWRRQRKCLSWKR